MGSRDTSVMVSLAVVALSVVVVFLLPGEHQTYMQQFIGKLKTGVADSMSNVSGAAASSQSVKQPDSPQAAAISTSPGLADKVAACKLSGQVAGCGCDYASVEKLVQQHLHPVLSELVRQPYFRYFKVNLYCDCQFWPDAGVCFQKDCCVAECAADEIPPAWLAEDEAAKEAAALNKACDGDSGVDRSVDEGVRGNLAGISGWAGLNNPWVPHDAADAQLEYIYVDLQRNPEKYTGYKGEDARRIWAAIYDQSALAEVAAAHRGGADAAAAVAREKEVLYRLISGMHTSITTSIVQNYYDEEKGTWGPNMPFFKARFASPAAKPFVENLYFTLLFVLRAVTKASRELSTLDFSTGQAKLDARTQALVQQLVHSPESTAACPTPFDEGLLWRHDNADHAEELRGQLQVAFHNITRLMDCVGCEKCKMHGKLNILGIAAAMKVLFSQPEVEGVPAPALTLQRNEAIALINLLGKLTDSVETVRSLSVLLASQEAEAAAAKAAATAAAA